MKEQILNQFDRLMSHLNSEENSMAEEFREQLEGLFKTKRLYVLSGGTDGYVSSHYTFDEEVAERVLSDDPECYPDDDCLDSIKVPSFLTYEDLGISYPLEDDE